MKVGRNDPCPCNSGVKFKKCCLKEIVKADLKSAEDTQQEDPVESSKRRERARVLAAMMIAMVGIQ